ncbi:MAG TPA: hypothetical protein VH414_19890 [Lichenihabitans sp.]|nr:hypothetical protein [Lichenihabitans sp.]
MTIVPERRQITTVIIETAAVANPETELDQDRVAALIGAGRVLIREAVEPFGGQRGQEVAGGRLLRFDFRRAQDNDVRRAVEVGLAVLEKVRVARDDLLARFGAAVEVRIGVHTAILNPGLSDSARTGNRRARSDDATAGAIGLRELAEPNSIVICALTARLAGAVAGLVPLGTTRIDGVDRPVEAFRICPSQKVIAPPEGLPFPVEDMVVLQVAAVIGQGFAVADVAALLDRTPDSLEVELASLVAAGLVESSEAGKTFRFSRDGLRDAAYDRLPLDMRRDLHGRYATMLAGRPRGPGDHFGTIGVHWARAHDPAKAQEAFCAAGAEALERGALTEAMRHFDDALDQAHLMHEATAIQKAKFAVELSRGQLFVRLRGYAAPEVEQCFTRAADLAQAVADDHDLFASLWGRATFHLSRGPFGRAADITRQMIDLAALTGDALLKGEAYRLSAWAEFTQGEFAAAETRYAQAFDVFDRLDPGTTLYGTRPAILARIGRAWLLWFLGRPNLAMDEIRLAEQQARTVGDPYARAFAFGIEAALAHLRQEPATVGMAGETCARIGREHSFPYWAAWGDIFAGWAAAVEGDGDGIARMRDGWDRYRATGAVQLDLYVRTLLADGLRRHDRAAEGLDLLDFDQVGSDTAAPYALAEAYLTRGRIQATLGHPADVATDLSAAVATARRQGSIMMERRAALCLRHRRRAPMIHEEDAGFDMMLVELSRP